MDKISYICLIFNLKFGKVSIKTLTFRWIMEC